MATKGREIDQVPCHSGPFVFRLEVSSDISAVDLESDVFVDIACIADMVDGNRYSCGSNVFGGLLRLGTWEIVKIRDKLVRIYIQFGILGQFFIFGMVVLVSFYPVGVEWPSEFFMEISDDRKVVDVFWLFCGSIVFADDESDAVDGHFAVEEPSELASMPESPMSGEECNKEEWSCEPAKFAAGGAAFVDGSVNRAGSVIETLMLVGCDFPSESATHWKQASV
jgi:hypothetical protein